MPEPELVRQPGRCTEDHRSVAGGLQYGTAAQQPGVSNPDGVRGGNRRGKRLWKSTNHFSTPLGNPANPAGFPLSHSHGDDGLTPCAAEQTQNQAPRANL